MTKTSSDDTSARSGPPSRPADMPLESLRAEVLAAAAELAGGQASSQVAGEDGGGKRGGRERGGGHATIVLERPRRAQFGDYSTNAALLLAPGLGEPPREVAERLGRALGARLGASLERYEVAGPGFLNLFLTDTWLTGALADAVRAGEEFGAGAAERPERIIVEFVSANPTGPMHVGHARNAAYGDALARMLAFHGNRVEREFYVNDAGSQVRKLGESIAALAAGEPVPDDGYRGAYVERLVDLAREEGEDPARLGRAAVAAMIEQMKHSLAEFRVGDFDRWAYESALHEGDPSPVAHTLAILERQGRTFTSEGALWLRTSEFGDDKDRVLVRSSGEHTYFASDIAYHQGKRERGFDRQIDVWGADHHGYIPRMKAAYAALGGDPDHLELLIMQLVHLVRSGERAQMSKRAGEFVTLDELMQEIGVDAARWYLLARSHDTTLDLDLDLAREQSSENPVYYVQYAHARIASMLRRAGVERVERATAAVAEGAGQPLLAAERALVEQLLAFPGELSEAAERRAPHRIAAYALELAQGFTAFYRDCRVVGAETETLESFRVALCVATRRTIARCLDLLGVSAPEEM
jgi:arginyl-tRNA synthetase